ncbi:TPA: ead/Ea22-like family protein [Escherichia coli]|nr:ead/Ea22-like family protein [Escherichia coli]
MESNIKGLVSAGNEMASELKAECGAVDMRSVAKLLSDLATQLEVQLVRANALAAENAGLKAGHSYFSYGSEHNFEWHKTAEEAIESAEAAIDDYRGDACDGWSEEVDSICWGIIMQSSTKVGERPRNEDDCCDPAIDTICDYALLPNIETPATDAFLTEIRAEARNEGINYTASRLAAAFNHGFINKSLREVFDVTRMILSAKEELANEPHPIDGLSGEYAEKSLEEWAEQIRKGGSQ